VFRTVLHQTYTRNIAVDTSGYSNNGIPIQVQPMGPGFGFDGPEARIQVRPSTSLSDLGCISAEVRFALAPQGMPQRYNLMEGFESFALYINPDLSISGTILDAAGNWTGATSASGLVTAGTQHRAAVQCDGMNIVRVVLDGKVVGANYAAFGAVRSVGALGLTIGHWPNPGDGYAFEGTIFEVLVQKYDPLSPLQNLCACCFDRAELAQWIKAFEIRLGSKQAALAAVDKLQASMEYAVLALRGGNAAQTRTLNMLASGIQLALRRQDLEMLEAVLKQIAVYSATVLDTAMAKALANDIESAFVHLDTTEAEWFDLLEMLCFSVDDKISGKI
jgi:hypothetical protein